MMSQIKILWYLKRDGELSSVELRELLDVVNPSGQISKLCSSKEIIPTGRNTGRYIITKKGLKLLETMKEDGILKQYIQHIQTKL